MQTIVQSLCGGVLIGVAAVILYAFNGRIMGVSGICSRLMSFPSTDAEWRLSFLAGLIAGGWIYASVFGINIGFETSMPLTIAAGFLVGFGTVWGNGCTSGHGVCGLARLSKRSLAATLIFMSTAMVTVWLRRLMGGM